MAHKPSIPDAYRGRVFGTLGMWGAFLELISVSMASILGGVVGILPLLNVSAGLSIAAGVVALLVLPDRRNPPEPIETKR